MKKIALITGVTGQDGSYLAEFLLKKRNDCNADICYMKTVDKEGKKKMRPSTVVADEETLMPYWLTDQQYVI